MHNQVAQLFLTAEVHPLGSQTRAYQTQEGQAPEMQNFSLSHFPIYTSAASPNGTQTKTGTVLGPLGLLAHTAAMERECTNK